MCENIKTDGVFKTNFSIITDSKFKLTFSVIQKYLFQPIQAISFSHIKSHRKKNPKSHAKLG